jgi:hypothetical protein
MVRNVVVSGQSAFDVYSNEFIAVSAPYVALVARFFVADGEMPGSGLASHSIDHGVLGAPIRFAAYGYVPDSWS